MKDNACMIHPLNVLGRTLEGGEKELVEKMLSALTRPDDRIEQIFLGSKFIGVQAGGRMGLSATLGAQPSDDEKDIPRELIGTTVKKAAENIKKPSGFLISLGLAAFNAGSNPDQDSSDAMDYPAEDLIASLGSGKVTGIVGDFPFIENLRKKVGVLHLFEYKDVPDAVPQYQWEKTLASLDVLAVTGTTLLTRRMAWYLSRAPQAVKIVLGPSTPRSPVLFEYGVRYLCGSIVTDIIKTGEAIRRDFSFRQIKKQGGIVFTRWQDR